MPGQPERPGQGWWGRAARAVGELWRRARIWSRRAGLGLSLLLSPACSGATQTEAAQANTTRMEQGQFLAPRIEHARRLVRRLIDRASAPGSAAPVSSRRPRVPYRCEEFHVELREDGRPRFRRHRRPWGAADQARFRRLLTLVAQEMGAEPRLLHLWALRESSYRPDAIHLLNPDRRASIRAWERFRWTEEKERTLRGFLQRDRKRGPAYYRARADLARILTFRDNPYYDDEVTYTVRLPGGARVRESRSRWAYGYGPFGFNPAYFLPVWDATAPPWIFCEADGIVAAVTAIWAARRAAADCRALGFGDSYEVVNRRFSGGRCTPRGRLDERFRSRARARGLDPSARARLGKRWPRTSTDRGQLLAHLTARAREAGLLSPDADTPRLARAPATAP